jgi:hypothetical protein
MDEFTDVYGRHKTLRKIAVDRALTAAGLGQHEEVCDDLFHHKMVGQKKKHGLPYACSSIYFLPSISISFATIYLFSY